jgi:hypothetical protein
LKTSNRTIALRANFIAVKAKALDSAKSLKESIRNTLRFQFLNLVIANEFKKERSQSNNNKTILKAGMMKVPLVLNKMKFKILLKLIYSVQNI